MKKIILICHLIIFLIISLIYCSGNNDSSPENTQVACNDGKDNDNDGVIDCADIDCINIGIAECEWNGDADSDGDGDGDCDGDTTDNDGDGIPNIYEDLNNNGIVDSGETDPDDPDTDNDGINDGVEVGDYCESPLDSDNDGKIDAVESNNFDTDGDGIFDNNDNNNSDGPCVTPPRLLTDLRVEIDTTLIKQCSPYVVDGTIKILNNSKLIIESGVTLKMRKQAAIEVGSIIDDSAGILEAFGTDTERIKITSDETSPEAGQWDAVIFEKTDGGGLRYADIEYGGHSIGDLAEVTGGIVILGGQDIEITNCIINKNKGFGVYAAIPDDNEKQTIFSSFSQNNLLINDYPLAIGINRIDELGENLVLNESLIESAIFLYGNNVTKDAVWKNFGVPYVLDSSTLNIFSETENNITINIDPGVVVKLPQNTLISIENSANLRTNGTEDNIVIFDSNNEQPVSGDWQGIRIDGNDSRFDFTKISHAGAASAYLTPIGAAIELTENVSSISFQNLTISNSSGYGIYYYYSECDNAPNFVDVTYENIEQTCYYYCFDDDQPQCKSP